MREDRRTSYRLYLSTPLVSLLHIKQINGKNVSTKPIKALVTDLSANGMRFESDIDLLSDNNMYTLECHLMLFYEKLKLVGVIVRKLQNRCLYEYAIDFQIDESEKLILMQLINELELKLRLTEYPEGCIFQTDQELDFIELNLFR